MRNVDPVTHPAQPNSPLALVIHREEWRRFEFVGETRPATLHYLLRGCHITFTHTFVPEELRGRGVAGALALEAITEARRRKWTVTARCPFVAEFLEHHMEFADLRSSGAKCQGDGHEFITPFTESDTQAARPKPNEHTLSLNPECRCDACGRFGAYRIADRNLCSECIAASGSCCSEFVSLEESARDS